ncbi:MAG: hypothetical protein F6J93_38230 [Oscillatoria sp. SIO1A7]|nr:hypothetical protein [Oscillatoria sp. SIO1A7]
MREKLDRLTREQATLIPVYRKKWQRAALSSEPIDRDRLKRLIKEAYAMVDKPEPEILFLPSPLALAEMMHKEDPKRLARRLGTPWPVSFQDSLYSCIKSGMTSDLWEELKQSFVSRSLLLWRISLYPAFEQLLVWGQIWSEWEEKEELKFDWEIQKEDWLKQLREQDGGEFVLGMIDFFWKQGGKNLAKQMQEKLWEPLRNVLPLREWERQLKIELIEQYGNEDLKYEGIRKVRDFYANPEIIDFCINVLNCPCDRRKWNMLQALVRDCGSFMLFENSCIICDRPTKLLLDEEYRFHAEGEPAIEFSDGFHAYYFHDTRLAERYGQVRPQEWKPEWLLSENNAEIRRLLIENIGYARICQELQALSLDTWREYELLKIEGDLDVEPIHLLKMTCPSTGKIHVLRVPPNLLSARRAIRWVNWDIDPDEFCVET